MTTAAQKAEKERLHAMRQCIARERLHLRVGDRRQDGTEVQLVGSVGELHGAEGLCTCCHGRNA